MQIAIHNVNRFDLAKAWVCKHRIRHFPVSIHSSEFAK